MMIDWKRMPGKRGGSALTGLVLVTLLITACGPGADSGDAPPPAGSPPPFEHAGGDAPDAGGTLGEAVVGQTVYVPVYSHIYSRDEAGEIDLAATLSVRNTDPEHPVAVTAVRYYDSAGRLVRRYGEGTVVLPPLSSRAYVVAEQDRTGGVGANFLVDWEAGEPVSPPLIEAVMISTASSQGISFVTRGVTVRSFTEAETMENR